MADIKLFRLSSSVYARRAGKILVLKRALGAMTGQWWLPSGGVDDGESPEHAAARELLEETGLIPAGPVRLISANPMHIYDLDSVQLSYVCDVPEGDVVLNPGEHSDFQWLYASDFRAAFNPERLALADAAGPGVSSVYRGCAQSLDDYIAFESHEFEDMQLRLMGMTAGVWVVRGPRVLLLQRTGGVGEGVWFIPGGVVDKGEDPTDAAVRELREETGLVAERIDHLRTWRWAAQNNRDAYHVDYIAHISDGDVVISHEHSDYRWMTPQEYADLQLRPEFDATSPIAASWLPEVRRNLALAVEWMARNATESSYP